jgi:hypothetical protein
VKGPDWEGIQELQEFRSCRMRIQKHTAGQGAKMLEELFRRTVDRSPIRSEFRIQESEFRSCSSTLLFRARSGIALSFPLEAGGGIPQLLTPDS